MNYSCDNMCVRNMISLELHLYESNGCFSYLKTQSFHFFYHYHYLKMTKLHLTCFPIQYLHFYTAHCFLSKILMKISFRRYEEFLCQH